MPAFSASVKTLSKFGFSYFMQIASPASVAHSVHCGVLPAAMAEHKIDLMLSFCSSTALPSNSYVEAEISKKSQIAIQSVQNLFIYAGFDMGFFI